MNKQDQIMKDVNKLASIVMQIACAADKWDINESSWCLDELGLGNRALSTYLRRGVIAIAGLQSSYADALDAAKLAKVGEQEIRAFMTDIFGDEDAESICDSDRQKIKAFVKSIDETSSDEKEGDRCERVQ